MKKHEVVTEISFKGKDIAKKFRFHVPAEDETEAFEKAMRFCEKSVKINIKSINDTYFPDEQGELDIEDPKEEKSYFQEQADMMQTMAQFEKLVEEMDVKEAAKEFQNDPASFVPKLEEMGNGFLAMAKMIKQSL